MVKAPGLAAGGTAAIRLPVPTGRRSVLTLGPALARQGDPLGLVTRVLSWGEPLELAVYPATVKAPLAGAGSVKDIEGRPAGRPSEADATFHALRDYQAGDDRRAIHWQSTARLGRLVVRQSEETRRLHLALVVSTAADEYASPGDFELAASVYASLGLSQLDSAGQLALVAQGGVLKLARGGRGPLLDQAAAAGLRRQPAGRGGLAAAAKLARLRLPATTLAVMVTGTVLGERQLRRVAALLPRQAAALAIRCRLGAALSVCHLGRLGLVTIGALDQLPQALKSAAAGRAGPGAAPPARAARAVGQADPVRPSHPGQPGYPGQPAGLAAARAARPMEPP
ncbi:MAG: DUF58 domain-containing protein [Bifidobacteriaceae bacterium]|nr:DUF58 domain-containing protein [Bifidobacteriaceae bacterium]